MIKSLAGLSESNLNTINIALGYCPDTNVEKAFSIIVEIMESSLYLVVKEMFSTRSNIIYWEKLLKSDFWEIKIMKWNSRFFRKKIITDQPMLDDMLMNPKIYTEYLESLKSDFNELAVTLAKFQNAASYLKQIYSFIQTNKIFSKSKKSQIDNSSILKLQHEAKRQISLGIRSIFLTYQAHLPNIYSDFEEILDINDILRTLSSSYNEDKDPDVASLERLFQSGTVMQDYLRTRIIETSTKKFPLEFSKILYPIPNNYERYWVRNAIVTIFGVYSLSVLVPMALDGSLRDLIVNINNAIFKWVHEHVVEPVYRLNQELMNTVSYEGHILSREELESSREVLRRMLFDFAKDREDLGLLERLRVLTKDSLGNITLNEPVFQRPKLDIPDLQGLMNKTLGKFTPNSDLEISREAFRRMIFDISSGNFNPNDSKLAAIKKFIEDSNVNWAQLLAKGDINLMIDKLTEKFKESGVCSTQSLSGDSSCSIVSSLKETFCSTQSSTKDDLSCQLPQTQPPSSVFPASTASSTSSNPSHNSTPSLQSSPVSTEKIVTSIPQDSSITTTDEALHSMMNKYENEIKSPIKGMISGNILTAILIQMQKLKVHTEAAMLTMDQINQLTLAVISSIPAFSIIGFAYYSLRNILSPRLSTRNSAIKLSLVMSDVERSLHDLLPFVGIKQSIAKDLQKIEQLSLSSDNNELKEQEELPDQESYWLLKGLFAFNLIRLRFKFQELFNDQATSIDKALIPSKAGQSISDYTQRTPYVPLSQFESCSLTLYNYYKSCKQCVSSVVLLIFGSNELLSNSVQYHSLDVDLKLLESPDSEISLERKIETMKRVRQHFQTFVFAR